MLTGRVPEAAEQAVHNGVFDNVRSSVGGGKKSVATKPSRMRMKNLPFHHDIHPASIEIEPSLWGLSFATCR